MRWPTCCPRVKKLSPFRNQWRLWSLWSGSGQALSWVGVTRVLVVDDDFMVAKLHCRYVSAVAGFTVAGVAHSGAEALRAAERLRPTWCCSTCSCPTWTASGCCGSCGRRGTARTRSSSRRRGTRDDPLGAAGGGAALSDQAVQPGGTARTAPPRGLAARPPGRSGRGPAGGRRPDLRHPPARLPRTPQGPRRPTADLVDAVLRAHPEGLSATECAEAGSCPGSAPAATWSTSRRRAARRSPSATAARAARNGGTGDWAEEPGRTGSGPVPQASLSASLKGP